MIGQRDRSLDLFKGMLVILMTWCHVMQFFGAPDVFPAQRDYETLINLLAFPSFVFAFGLATAMSYYSRPFRKAGPRMALSALKSLGAFYLSGIAFRVLREGKAFASGTVRRILLLQDLPGWSEFLASFAALAMMAIVFYWPLKRLKDRPLWLLPIALACLALCWLPYERIEHPLLRLFFGTTAYAAFPPFQYFPYFLAGLAYARLKDRGWWWLALLALLSTGLGVWRGLSLGHLPSRFPPDWGWILLPAAGTALLMALARGLDWLGRALSRLATRQWGKAEEGPGLSRLLRGAGKLSPLRPIEQLGRNSLFYLLAGNLALFALAGRGTAPQLKFKAPGLFGQPIAAPQGALWWTLALLLAAALVAGLIRPRPSARPSQATTEASTTTQKPAPSD